MGEKQQPKSCIYSKPKHYSDLADKPITKDGIMDNAIEIIYICAYKAERFVNKQYVGVSVESREDIIQYVAGQIKDLIENYLDKIDEKRVDFWAYMNKSIQYTASRAYQTEVKDGASEYIRHRYDMMSKYLDEGLTLEEIAEKCNCRVSTVRKTLRDGKVTHVSIDAEDDIGHAILDKVGKNDVYKIEEEKESIENNILIRKVLKGMTREEKFIIETYLNIKKDCEKEWKDRTFAACKEYGITHKKVNDAIRNFKNEARKMRDGSSG